MTTETQLLAGGAGQLEVLIDRHASPTGLALISHPHPLGGGSADNKVVTTLARALLSLGCVALRPQFRGVGRSEGQHDHGEQETLDQLAVLRYARARFGQSLPIYLAGFSFGAFVTTRMASQLQAAGTPARRLILVGTAYGLIEGLRDYQTEAVPADTIVIHGSRDETVPLQNVFDWAEPQNLPVIVVAGADHFFHRRLHILRQIILQNWAPVNPAG